MERSMCQNIDPKSGTTSMKIEFQFILREACSQILVLESGIILLGLRLVDTNYLLMNIFKFLVS